MRRLAALVLVALAAPRLATAEVGDRAGVEPRAEPPRLQVTPSRAAILATGALVLWGASAIENAGDEVTGCRWCEPGQFDRWARGELRWSSGDEAGRASDLLLLGVPLGSAAVIGSLAALEGDRRELIEDLLVLATAIAITDSLTTGVKHGAGRLRPHAWADGGPRVEGDLHSFFSGHTSRAFAAAGAAAQIARLRRRSGSRWIAVAAFAAAAATGWLRVAADQHWATDVLAGAAVGSAVGWGVATVALRPVERSPSNIAISPAPGGIAISF